MLCSVLKELLVLFSFNLSISFSLLSVFFHFSSIFLARFFLTLLRKTAPQSSNDGYEFAFSEEIYGLFSVEFVEDEDMGEDLIHGGESLLFLPVKSSEKDKLLALEEDVKTILETPNEIFISEQSSIWNLESEVNTDNVIFKETLSPINPNENCPVPIKETFEEQPSIWISEFKVNTDNVIFKEKISPINPNENCPVAIKATFEEARENQATKDQKNLEDEVLKISPYKLETEKIQFQETVFEEIYGDSSTSGSISKNSSEWKSSVICRDSGNEDPFSSSSRRSGLNWESYTIFPKYDEEMTFFHRISAQKLNETESLRGIEACPSSISQRIVHKLMIRNKSSNEINPYHELENAYVAQICLAWEALNWNYKNYQRLIASGIDEECGCPGQIVHQFQRFQVLLQRYIEDEPFEHGKRPEVFTRARISTPELLQVPDLRGSEDNSKEEGLNTRVSSAKFVVILEEAIQTFMNFLKADREKHFHIFTALFKRKHNNLVDPTFFHLMKKANTKKKKKLKDLLRTRKCLRKRRMKKEEEMEILMGLIDLKVVSRVLKMSEISEEKLHWCEDKMSKIKVWDGKLQRDSSPLFFPAH